VRPRQRTLAGVATACFLVVVGLVGLSLNAVGVRGPTSVGQPAVPDRWAVAADASATVDPQAVLDSYQAIERDLFIAHPDEWGGAYYDGPTLVINTVSGSGPDAVRLLRAMGVPAGVVVRKTSISLADFDRATSAMNADDVLHPLIASIGPDYQTAELTIGMRSGSSQATARGRIDAILDRLGLTQVRYSLVDGGVPAAALGR
jgi:hypothetical protein